MGLPGLGDPTFIVKIEQSWARAYFLKSKNRRRQLVERSPGFYAPNPTRFGSPAGVPTFVGMNRRNPGSKPPGHEAKGGLVGKWDQMEVRIGPSRAPISPRRGNRAALGLFFEI